MERFGASPNWIDRWTSNIGNGKATPQSFGPPGNWSSYTAAIGAWIPMNSDFKDLLKLFNNHKVRYLSQAHRMTVRLLPPRAARGRQAACLPPGRPRKLEPRVDASRVLTHGKEGAP